MTDSPALKNGNTLTYHGDSVPKPLGFFAFPLTEAQTGWFCRHPVPVSPKVGAPVASQRCRILRSGSVSLPQAHEKHKILPKYFLPNRLPTRYNYLCPGYFLLAGFEVTTIGRIWGDHRGRNSRAGAKGHRAIPRVNRSEGPALHFGFEK